MSMLAVAIEPVGPPLRAEWITVEPRKAPGYALQGFVVHSEVMITPHHPTIGSPQIYCGGSGGVHLARVPRVIMWRERD